MIIELDGIVNEKLQELKSTWNRCYHETGNWHDMRFAIEQLFMAVYGNIDGTENKGDTEMKPESIEDIVHELRNEWATLYFSEGGRTRNGEYPNTVCVETGVLADRIEAACERYMANCDTDDMSRIYNQI